MVDSINNRVKRLAWFLLGVATILLAEYSLSDAMCIYKGEVSFCTIKKGLNPDVARDHFEWGMKDAASK